MMNTVETSRDLFNILGIWRFKEELKHLADEMIQNTLCYSGGKAFARLRTFIPTEEHPPVIGQGPALVLDIGGSHTRIYSESDGNWKVIADIKYTGETAEQIRNADCPMQCFSDLCMQAIHQAGIKEPRGMAVIWSNAAKCEELNPDFDGASGVTAIVHSRHEAYHKNEPFIVGLEDGDKLHSFFQKSAGKYGLKIPAILICNDVPVSVDGNAGLVASTGSNGTFFINGERYNAELGALFDVPAHMLSDVEKRRHDSLSLEDLMAGRGIARRFREHVIAVGDGPMASNKLRAFAAKLRQDECIELDAMTYGKAYDVESFRTENLSTLVKVNEGTYTVEDQAKYSDLLHEWEIDDKDADELVPIAKALILRAAYLAGFMAWISVANQIDESPGGDITVGLESSLARNVPHYHDEMKRAFSEFLGSKWHGVVNLLSPLALPDGSHVTVPALGAEKALRHFVKQA